MARRRDKGQERRIASERLHHLLDLATAEALGPDHDLANRYAGLAKRLQTRYQLKAPLRLKLAVCKGCTQFLRPGVSSRTRMRHGKVVTTCLACGRVRRRPVHTEDP